MKVFGKIFGFFTVWQSFEPTFANFHTFGEKFNCCKWPLIRPEPEQSRERELK